MEFNLNEIQFDALKEIGNIGAGNAATALSQLINKKVDMTVPQVDVLLFNDMVSRIGDDEDLIIAVLLKVFGDAPGNILFVMKPDSAKLIANEMLTGLEIQNDEIYYSVYQELGNILGNSYLNALSRFTGLNLVGSVPYVVEDMLAAILSTTFIDAEQYSDYVLAIDTTFMQENKESGGYFFYVPMPGSLEKILSKLGL